MRPATVVLALLVSWLAGLSPAWAQQRPVLTPVPCANLEWRYADPAFDALPDAKAYAGRYDGGTYRIEVPDNWNGELVLWAHGNRADTGPNGSLVASESVGATPGGVTAGQVAGAELFRQHLIRSRFAWAASSYRCNGSIQGIGLLDTLRLLEEFPTLAGVSRPDRVYLLGASMGGGITLRAMHLLPTTFAGALAMCPASPSLGDFRASLVAAAEAISGVRLRPGTFEADLAAMLAVLGTPPNYTQKGRQLASVQISISGGDRPFALEGLAPRFEANLREAVRQPTIIRASTNRDTRYTLDERLGLTAAALNQMVTRVVPDETLRGPQSPYLEVSSLDGRIQRPLMTIHGTGDLQVPIGGQRALRRIVDSAGTSNLLVQRIMRIPGHCRFSNEEQIQSFDALVTWVREGIRPEGDDVMMDLRDAGRRFTTPLRPGDPGTLGVPLGARSR